MVYFSTVDGPGTLIARIRDASEVLVLSFCLRAVRLILLSAGRAKQELLRPRRPSRRQYQHIPFQHSPFQQLPQIVGHVTSSDLQFNRPLLVLNKYSPFLNSTPSVLLPEP